MVFTGVVVVLALVVLVVLAVMFGMLVLLSCSLFLALLLLRMLCLEQAASCRRVMWKISACERQGEEREGGEKRRV